MQKIKDKLIKKLGGFTRTEYFLEHPLQPEIKMERADIVTLHVAAKTVAEYDKGVLEFTESQIAERFARQLKPYIQFHRERRGPFEVTIIGTLKVVKEHGNETYI